MSLYPPLEETGDKHRLQHLAEVKFRLEKERDARATLYKKYWRWANVVNGLDTALSVASLGFAASGVGLLSTINAAPFAVGIKAGLLVAGGKILGQKLQTKARKHDQIHVLAESKLNSFADRISTALNEYKISDEEFRLIMSELEKYNQVKSEFRGCQKQGDLSEEEKNSCYSIWNTKPVPSFWKSSTKLETVAPLDKYFLLASLKELGRSGPRRLLISPLNHFSCLEADKNRPLYFSRFHYYVVC